MPGVSTNCMGLDGELLARGEAACGGEPRGALKSASVGESPPEAAGCKEASSGGEPRSTAVGWSSRSGVGCSPEEPLLTAISFPEDDEPLSSGRGRFLGTIECLQSTAGSSAEAAQDSSPKGGKVSIRRVDKYTTTANSGNPECNRRGTIHQCLPTLECLLVCERCWAGVQSF